MSDQISAASRRMRLSPQPGQIHSTSTTPVVLIVDDAAEFRGPLATVLRERGFVVEEASDGGEALDKLRWGLQPRVILLDMQMRVMTGWDFRAEQLRDPKLAEIPVVAMTAGPWKERDTANFAHRFQKPLDLERLWSVLESYRR